LFTYVFSSSAAQYPFFQREALRGDHRNLRTGRRMHFCMQDDQSGPKIVGLAPADMARLPPSIFPTKIFSSSKQTRLSAGTTYTYFEPALLYKGNHPFLGSTFSFEFLDFYGGDIMRHAATPGNLFSVVVFGRKNSRPSR
jgi:hypothetical protein